MIVDFWATWCGPCKTLGPALEKAVLAAKGAVKLVKIDIDKNPVFAGQLRVQSIPTVYAFVDGRPVDGFMGAVPESQIKAFIDRLAASGGGAAGSEIDALIAMAKELLELGDIGGAAQAFAQALQAEPDNVPASAASPGLPGRRRRRAGGEIVAMAPATPRTPTWRACAPRWRSPRTRRPTPPRSSSASPRTLPTTRRGWSTPRRSPAAATSRRAVDQLLTIIEADREWNDQAARKQLLTVFEAAGLASEVARQGRRRLSAILFG